MDKLIRLSENKIMVFYHVPIVLRTRGNEKQSQVIGHHKLKVRYNISNIDKIHEYNPKRKFGEIIKNKFKTSRYDFGRDEEFSNISIGDGGFVKIRKVNSINIYIPSGEWDSYIEKYLVEGRNKSIDDLLNFDDE